MPDESNARRYREGHVVQVAEGPFAGCMGTIEAIAEPARRLRVIVPIFGRPTPMEFAFDEVRKR